MKDRFAAWPRILVNMMLAAAQSRGHRDPETGHQTLMMFDEFAPMERMRKIEAAADIAGAGVKMFFVVQSLTQLKAVYGEAGKASHLRRHPHLLRVKRRFHGAICEQASGRGRGTPHDALSKHEGLDLSRICAARLTTYRVAKENTDGITTNRGIRAEAVRVALISELPRKQVAADSGIGFSTLNRWTQRDRRNPEKPKVQSDLEREIAELRIENRMLREERDVVKKATVYFAERRK